jgi:hypothetical protein
MMIIIIIITTTTTIIIMIILIIIITIITMHNMTIIITGCTANNSSNVAIHTWCTLLIKLWLHRQSFLQSYKYYRSKAAQLV